MHCSYDIILYELYYWLIKSQVGKSLVYTHACRLICIASTVSDQSAYTIELHWNHYRCFWSRSCVSLCFYTSSACCNPKTNLGCRGSASQKCLKTVQTFHFYRSRVVEWVNYKWWIGYSVDAVCRGTSMQDFTEFWRVQNSCYSSVLYIYN